LQIGDRRDEPIFSQASSDHHHGAGERIHGEARRQASIHIEQSPSAVDPSADRVLFSHRLIAAENEVEVRRRRSPAAPAEIFQESIARRASRQGKKKHGRAGLRGYVKRLSAEIENRLRLNAHSHADSAEVGGTGDRSAHDPDFTRQTEDAQDADDGEDDRDSRKELSHRADDC
jgi:hypothetical protein